MKSENKELRYQLVKNLENLKEEATMLQKCIVENGTLKNAFLLQIKKLESWKLIKQKNEYDPSFLLNLEALKEQVKFLENGKLLLKEQVDNFRNNKTHLFKKSQYSNSTCAAYQDLISFADISANKVEKVLDIVLTQTAGIQVDQLPKSTYAKDMEIESRGV